MMPRKGFTDERHSRCRITLQAVKTWFNWSSMRDTFVETDSAAPQAAKARELAKANGHVAEALTARHGMGAVAARIQAHIVSAAT